MKIGILTFTEGYNYGNKLQNYALLTYLNNNFPCEAKTINNHITWTSPLKMDNRKKAPPMVELKKLP